MEKTYLREVGERLAECRANNLYSRKELAERAGVPVAIVKMMECGEDAVGIDDALKICNELDCSIEYMLTGNCGFKEIAKLNQKILNLPNIRSENLEIIAKAFWDSRPAKMY